MQQAVRKPLNGLPIKDHSLFRQQCYIDGAWADADSGKAIDVTNPAAGVVRAPVPNWAAD